MHLFEESEGERKREIKKKIVVHCYFDLILQGDRMSALVANRRYNRHRYGYTMVEWCQYRM